MPIHWCIFGDLSGLFPLLKSALNVENGICCFTIELNPFTTPNGYTLTHTGRYQHDLQYITDLAAQNSMRIDQVAEVQLRQGGGNWVDGLLIRMVACSG